MEFGEMEIRASQCEVMPLQLSMTEQQCYTTLRNLYCDYHEGRISLHDAIEEKQKIKNKFNSQVKVDHFYIQLAYKQQENIKRAEEVKRDIGRRIRDKEKADLLFLKVVECIAYLTDDSAFYETIKSGMGDKS